MKKNLILVGVIMLISNAPSAQFFTEPATTAVIVVDVQHDFTQGRNGALAVSGTDTDYLDKVTEATKKLSSEGCFIVATRDYHPPRHISFASTHDTDPFQILSIQNEPRILWPDHCVQDTVGSEILIPREFIDYVQPKGMKIKADSYSGFLDDDQAHTGLHEVLSSRGVKTLIIYGIATDYCVKATAMDGIELGYRVYVINGLSRGVAEESSTIAKKELQDRGVILVESLENL